jgi:hypothetical protein
MERSKQLRPHFQLPSSQLARWTTKTGRDDPKKIFSRSPSVD